LKKEKWQTFLIHSQTTHTQKRTQIQFGKIEKKKFARRKKMIEDEKRWTLEGDQLAGLHSSPVCYFTKSLCVKAQTEAVWEICVKTFYNILDSST
jgi:hypothetical protein